MRPNDTDEKAPQNQMGLYTLARSAKACSQASILRKTDNLEIPPRYFGNAESPHVHESFPLQSSYEIRDSM